MQISVREVESMLEQAELYCGEVAAKICASHLRSATPTHESAVLVRVHTLLVASIAEGAECDQLRIGHFVVHDLDATKMVNQVFEVPDEVVEGFVGAQGSSGCRKRPTPTVLEQAELYCGEVTA